MCVRNLVLILSIICLVVFPELIYSQDDSSNQIKSLFDACDTPDFPGGFAAAVVKDGKIVFKKGYGYANYEHKIPFTTSTVADYASVAKQFTGFAVAMLINKGKLDLKDDIRRYLPEVPDFGEKITISHLLYHTSGIRDWVGLVKISGRYKGDVITDDFIMKLVQNQKDLNFKSGENFQYSNTGYFLLARIVSSITKRSFRAWTQENIFEPLQMNDTHFCDDYRDIILNRASSYKRNEMGYFVNNPSHLESYGSSSLFSTIEDITKWVVNFKTKKRGGQDIWDMMFKKGFLNNNKEINYGFGFSINENRGLVHYIHGGSWGGYLSQVSYYPEMDLAYILISNRDPSGVGVDEDILNVLLGKKLKIEDDTKEKVKQRIEVEIDPDLLQDYIGTYKWFENSTFEIGRTKTHLVVHFPWGDDVIVYPESLNKFFRKDFDVQFTFLRDEHGKVNRLIYRFLGEDNLPFKKLDSDVSGYLDVTAFLGDYYSHELQVTYKVKIENNRLIVENLQNEDVMLLQIDKDNYLGDKWWFTKIRLIRNQNNQVKEFEVNADSNNIQKLSFVKIDRDTDY